MVKEFNLSPYFYDLFKSGQKDKKFIFRGTEIDVISKGWKQLGNLFYMELMTSEGDMVVTNYTYKK
jgi:hypothetical protein